MDDTSARINLISNANNLNGNLTSEIQIKNEHCENDPIYTININIKQEIQESIDEKMDSKYYSNDNLCYTNVENFKEQIIDAKDPLYIDGFADESTH